MTEDHTDEIQRKIYNLITHNPGIHLSKIAELLSLKITEVEAYLYFLEKKGLISVLQDAGYKQYYPQEQFEKLRDKRSCEIRKKIYMLLGQNPGLHLSRIAELLEMSVPSVDYHLLNMERNGEIFAMKGEKGYYKRYYLEKSEQEKPEAIIFEIISKKVPLKIILLLIKYRTLQHKEILEHLNIASSTLSYHLAQLIENGIVFVQFRGEEKGYSLQNQEEIIRILKRYEVHIEFHLALEDFKDLWDGLRYLND